MENSPQSENIPQKSAESKNICVKKRRSSAEICTSSYSRIGVQKVTKTASRNITYCLYNCAPPRIAAGAPPGRTRRMISNGSRGSRADINVFVYDRQGRGRPERSEVPLFLNLYGATNRTFRAPHRAPPSDRTRDRVPVGAGHRLQAE